MKVTLITTVKNEESSIEKFLYSVNSQTRKPDEVVIVDGGSTDKTVSIIYELLSMIKIPTRIIKKKGNRSVGRNTAVKNSSFNIIACTDAGCILDKYWLERIADPFNEPEVDVASGFYKPKTYSIFERCLATYTCTMSDLLDNKNFLPSSRSIAFRKKAWEKVKGYPEKLDTCEDLIFDKKLKKAGMKFVTVKNAVVYWPQRKNIFQAAVQFFRYAKGDGAARYFRKSTPFLFVRYVFGTFIIVLYLLTLNKVLLFTVNVLLFLYIIWSIRKNYKYVKKWQAFIWLPILQISSDIMVMFGTVIGFIESQEKV
jgi:glycosyltransferase involved in cell wall biosynthesis